MSVTSLILGIVAIVCVCAPVISFFVWLAVHQAKKRREFVSRLDEHGKAVIADFMQIW